MKINSSTYSDYLQNEFINNAAIFNSIIEEFNNKNKITGSDVFIAFMEKSGYYNTESKLFNYALELYHNLSRYFMDGVLELYLSKQAEWGAPEVKITEADVPQSDIHLLNEYEIIYRGLSFTEHATRKYGQSWTLDLATALRFAVATYSGKANGIVVSSKIEKKYIIYYKKLNGEKEVIIKYGSVKNATKVKT